MFDWAMHTRKGMLIFIDEAVRVYSRVGSAHRPALTLGAFCHRTLSCPSAAAAQRPTRYGSGAVLPERPELTRL